MAGRYLIKLGGTYVDDTTDIWDALNWPADPNGDGLLFDEAADNANLEPEVTGDFTLDGAMACAIFSAELFTGTIALGANALDSNGVSCYFEGTITGTGDISSMGTVTFAAGTDTDDWSGTVILDAVAGSKSFWPNGVTIPALTVDNNGVQACTLQGDLTVGALTYTAGKFTTTGRTITLKAGTHDVDWATSGYRLAHCIVPDAAKMEMTGHVYLSEFTVGAGVDGASVASAGAKIIVFYCAGNDSWHQTRASGTVSIQQLQLASNGSYEVGYLDGSNFTAGVIVHCDGNQTITLTDAWGLGAKALAGYGDGDGETLTLDANGHDLTAGVVTLGATALDKSGVIIARSARHSFISVISGDAANQNNAYDFGTGQTRLSTADNNFDNIAVTGGGAQVVAASINHCDVTGLLRAWAVKDAGDNVNVEWQPRALGIMPVPGLGMMRLAA